MELQIDEVMLKGHELRSSDIFFKDGSPPVFRLNGKISRSDYPALNGDDIRRLAYSLMTPQQIQRFEQRREMDLGFSRPFSRFRGNVYMQKGTVGMVLYGFTWSGVGVLGGLLLSGRLEADRQQHGQSERKHE